MHIYGVRGNYLEIDMGEKKYNVKPIPESYYQEYLGGRAMGSKICFDEQLYLVDPLGEENQIIMSVGPFTGTMIPGVGKTIITTRSPLTNIYLDSAVGGRLAHNIKAAGYDGLVIKGKSKSPVYLNIYNEKVEFIDAQELLWGKGCIATESLLRKRHGHEVAVGCIGPAGENLVKFACFTVDFHHQAGRGGIGAIMGSKNLKAIVVNGNQPLETAYPKELFSFTHNFMKEHKNDEKIKYRKKYGTLSNLDLTQKTGIVPVKNFSEGVTALYDELNGDSLLKYIVKNLACFGCPIPCGKAAVFKRDGKEYLYGGPEYETIGLMGTNLEMKAADLMYLGYLVDDLGLDSICSGALIGACIEAVEQGGLSHQQLNGLKWGGVETVAQVLSDITYRRGIGDQMAEGLYKFREAYNLDKDIDVTVKGMGLPAYDPRGTTGYALAYSVSDRGACHRRGTSLFEEMSDGKKRFAYEGKADFVINIENEKVFYHSLAICDFIPHFCNLHVAEMSDLLALVTGLKFNEADALRLGADTIDRNRIFNINCGMTRQDDFLPSRFYNRSLQQGEAAGKKVDFEKFEAMLDDYYKARGWSQQGVPAGFNNH